LRRRQKTEDRRQKTEDRRQKTEDRRQKTEDRRQRSENREHDVLGSSRVDGPTAEVGGELAGVNESTESETSNAQRPTPNIEWSEWDEVRVDKKELKAESRKRKKLKS
jgi:hypothetical protein